MRTGLASTSIGCPLPQNNCMPKGWSWDPSLFEGSAAFYQRGRLPYPASLAPVLKATLSLDVSGRLLDVGCGPGTVALDVAHLFSEVVGVDANSEMIVEATRLAKSRRITNSRFLNLRAEALSTDLGTFRVATFAQSFHWMERETVAAIIYTLLEPGGAFVHVDCAPEVRPPMEYLEPERPPMPDVPRDSIDRLIQSYLGPQRRAGRGVLLHGTPSGESEVVTGVGFGPPLTTFVGGGEWHVRSTDDLVAWVFAASGSAPHLFGTRLRNFERDLRSLLAESSASGTYAQRAPFMQLRTWVKG